MRRVISRYGVWMMAGVLLLLSSCKKDGDSYYMGVSYGNVEASGTAYNIRTDDGTMLYVQETSCVGVTVDDGDRVMASYTILEEVETGYNIRLNFLQNILTKTPVYLSQIAPTEQEQIGNDPVNVLALSFGGKYLNVKMELFREDPQLAHRIELVVDEQRSDDQNVYLTLRHNAYEDPTSIATMQRVSFDLSGLVPEGQQEIMVYVEWTDYMGVQKEDSGLFTLKEE